MTYCHDYEQHRMSADVVALREERDAAIRERDEARQSEKAAWNARDDAVAEAAQIKDACDTAVSMARADEARALARVKVLEKELEHLRGVYRSLMTGSPHPDGPADIFPVDIRDVAADGAAEKEPA